MRIILKIIIIENYFRFCFLYLRIIYERIVKLKQIFISFVKDAFQAILCKPSLEAVSAFYGHFLLEYQMACVVKYNKMNLQPV